MSISAPARLSVDGGPTASIGTTLGSFTTALNSALGSNGSASFTNGQLSISAGGGNGVVVQENASTPSARGGLPFSQFFGLNDLFQSAAPSTLATGLSGSDASGLAAGGQIAMSLKGPDGDIVKQVSVTTTAGMTIANVVSALNSAMGGAATFTLNSNGSIATTTSALYPNYQLNVTADTTQRGTTGMSFTQLFGIGANQAANQAASFNVVPAVANTPQRIGLATPGITPSTVAGDTVVLGGDNSGAIALQNVITATQNFSAAGGIAAQTASLSDYAAAFYQNVSTQSNNVTQNQTTQDDRLHVVENERVRPQREAQVMRHGAELGQGVGRPRGTLAEADGMSAEIRPDDQAAEQEPRGGQARIQPPVVPQRLAEGPADKSPVVEPDDQRRGHHDLLGRHAEETAGERECGPSLFSRPGGAARAVARYAGAGVPDETIQSQQVKEPHERLRPLRDVGDRFGLEGMHDPEDRHGQRGKAGPARPEPRAAAGTGLHGLEGAPDDSEKRQGRQDMDRKVQRVITPDGRAADRVIDSQGKVDEGPPVNRQPAAGLRGKNRTQAGQTPDRRVVRDRRGVVEDERPGERIGKGAQTRGGNRQSGDPAGVPFHSIQLTPPRSRGNPRRCSRFRRLNVDPRAPRFIVPERTGR